jgi:hypothetical protein
VGLKLNTTYQLLFCVDVVNVLGDDIDTIKKNAENLIDSSKVGWSRSKDRKQICGDLSSPECSAKS